MEAAAAAATALSQQRPNEYLSKSEFLDLISSFAYTKPGVERPSHAPLSPAIFDIVKRQNIKRQEAIAAASAAAEAAKSKKRKRKTEAKPKLDTQADGRRKKRKRDRQSASLPRPDANGEPKVKKAMVSTALTAVEKLVPEGNGEPMVKKTRLSTALTAAEKLSSTVNCEPKVKKARISMALTAADKLALEGIGVPKVKKTRVSTAVTAVKTLPQKGNVEPKVKKARASTALAAAEKLPEGNVEPRVRKAKASHALTAAEKWMDAYRRLPLDHSFIAPRSPYGLLQEPYACDPWKVMLICMLLNMTTGLQVSKILKKFFKKCSTAQATLSVCSSKIEKLIQTLGLQKKRAVMIKRFSAEYLSHEWTHVTQLHGIGKYAADAYAIFCAGKASEVVPRDHMLCKYWRFVCGYDTVDEESAGTIEQATIDLTQ